MRIDTSSGSAVSQQDNLHGQGLAGGTASDPSVLADGASLSLKNLEVSLHWNEETSNSEGVLRSLGSIVERLLRGSTGSERSVENEGRPALTDCRSAQNGPVQQRTAQQGTVQQGTAQHSEGCGKNASAIECPADQESSTADVAAGTKSFKEFVSGLLKPDANFSVSEEKLQYGILSYQLYQKSPELAQEFRNLFEAGRDDGLRIKDAAKQALEGLHEKGLLANWEVDWVYSLSHRAAQLDSSHNGINPRSNEDISFEDALHRAELALVGIQSGSIAVKERGPLQVGWSIDLQNPGFDSQERVADEDPEGKASQVEGTAE